MVSLPASASVGADIVVSSSSVLCVFVGFCVTVSPVPMFSVSSGSGCGIPSKVIVLSYNDYVIFCIIDTMNIFQSEGVGGGGRWWWYEVGWCVLGGEVGAIDWFKFSMRNVLLKLLMLFMCYARLGPKLAFMPGA